MRKLVLDRVARGEVSVVQACRDAGWSRTRFYELRSRYHRYGEAGLLPKPRPPTRPDRRLPEPLVDQIVAYAIEHPGEGPRTIAARLALPRFGSWSVSHGGIYNVLRRAGLHRRSARLAAAEAVSASEGGPITERALRDLRALEVQRRHIGSDTVGEQVFLDTMYVGNLKGVGKVWQYSAVDGACSFGFAHVRAGKKTASTAAEFLEHHVLPAYTEAGIVLKEVVVDGGPEFKGEFRRRCKALGIRRHQLPPRSPDLNAFVERFQGTVLHLHYRTAFRYRFYTGAADIDADLAGWLRFYNFERPHRGYRTKSRRPAEIFYADRPALLVMKGWDVDEFTPQTVRS
jgi:transposase InsO family protein